MLGDGLTIIMATLVVILLTYLVTSAYLSDFGSEPMLLAERKPRVAKSILSFGPVS